MHGKPKSTSIKWNMLHMHMNFMGIAWKCLATNSTGLGTYPHKNGP